MAQVKISDLPSLSSIKSNDVIIVNDSSDNTTKKALISNFTSTSTHSITLNPSLTCTTTSFSCTLHRITPALAFFYTYIPGNLNIFNNTSSTVLLSFTLPFHLNSNSYCYAPSPIASSFTGPFNFNGDDAFSNYSSIFPRFLPADSSMKFSTIAFNSAHAVLIRDAVIDAGDAFKTGNGFSVSAIIAL